MSKLVRDKIVDIIKSDAVGVKVDYEQLTDARFVEFLNRKLQEEVNEYLADYDPAELIDILEVVYTIAKVNGITEDELLERRLAKITTRGAFNDKILLKEVTYPGSDYDSYMLPQPPKCDIVGNNITCDNFEATYYNNMNEHHSLLFGIDANEE